MECPNVYTISPGKSNTGIKQKDYMDMSQQLYMYYFIKLSMWKIYKIEKVSLDKGR